MVVKFTPKAGMNKNGNGSGAHPGFFKGGF